MPGLKEIKIRIKSIGGMRRTTRAMQLVSAAKMRKAQDATLRSRTYASLAWELIENIESSTSSVIPEDRSAPDGLSGIQDQAQGLDAGSSTFAEASADLREAGMTHMMGLLKTYPGATKTLVLILSTNRGLVGSLNTNLLNAASRVIARSAADEAILSGNEKIASARQSPGLAMTQDAVDIVTYGKKAREWSVRSHKEVIADFEKFDRSITTEDIYPISQLITQSYQSGKYKQVVIVYNHFVSTLVQEPRVKQLLPFSQDRVIARSRSASDGDEAILTSDKKIASARQSPGLAMTHETNYLFEPSPSEVLQHLLPRIIESQIYQTILESEASEQSARMVMMKNATEAAGDLISDLTLTYNKLRQNKITTELAEITAGKIALE